MDVSRQLGLFEYPQRAASSTCPTPNATPPRARRNDPVTSKLAAAACSSFREVHYSKIIKALRAGPGNYREIAARAGLERHAVARRLKELETDGYIDRTGEKRDRCDVWELCTK